MTGKEVVDHLIHSTGMSVAEVRQVCKEAVAFCDGWLEDK